MDFSEKLEVAAVSDIATDEQENTLHEFPYFSVVERIAVDNEC